MTNFQYILLPVVPIISFINYSELIAQKRFIRLAWSPNLEPHFSHYKLYRDTEPGIMVYLTTIEYRIPEYTNVSTIGFSVLGKEIRRW